MTLTWPQPVARLVGLLRARRVPHLLLVAGLVAGLGPAGRVLADDGGAQVDGLARTLERDPSEKARISAAVSLGRLADPRSVGSLMRALGDPSALVRGLAASALGHLGDPSATAALERALSDPDDGVRARVRDALSLLRPKGPPPAPAPAVPTRVQMAPREAPRRPSLHVVVKAMAARGSRQLSDRMRAVVVSHLAREPGVTVDADGSNEALIVDGSITRMTSGARGPWIETTCEVKLTVSSSAGSLLSIVTGGATVQTPRGAWNRRIEPTAQAEALDGALEGLRANLVTLLNRHSR